MRLRLPGHHGTAHGVLVKSVCPVHTPQITPDQDTAVIQQRGRVLHPSVDYASRPDKRAKGLGKRVQARKTGDGQEPQAQAVWPAEEPGL